MVTVRSIIAEALSRANLVAIRRTAPADMTESAFRLLKGIAAKYSNDDLLQFLVSEVTTDLDRQEYVIGETDQEHPEEYMELDVEAPGLQRVNKVYWRSKDPSNVNTYVELSFANPNDYDAYPFGSGVYTWQPVSDLQGILKTKLCTDANCELKITYNRKWNIGLDSELRIPEQYVELFIVALTHALAMAFPRLSTEQVTLLKNQLTEMEKNIASATRAIKYIGRTPRRTGISRTAFLSGNMFYGG